MDLVERFINYTKFDTQSSEESTSVPSTAKQLEFAKYLKKELENEGLSDVEMDDMGYIYATLKSNTKKKTPTIGFISHMDTSPDASGKDVKARVIKNYDGNDIELSPGIISSVETFPELKAHKGEDIIVTDGTTLLGADDKAGVAEIMTAVETGSSLDREMIANFPAMLPGLAFQTYIRKNIDVKKAPLALQPLCFFSPRCTATGDYAALCDEMLARMEG